ncbi:hypothetical protein CCZ01_05335 [Helicobacter monodelphidis]|uniref:major outer membrane protein n=1 Tax=Helicobacter sp. 15-1451 TaxID=2004995 RepID=UPI000DCD7390|nr:major outer membrane protein [Helicobacter sp. 15-1451]RAX57709.1 hypothetical protein CCZ01_05335 [Helicobacter sp. 15-1451]
MIKTSLKTSYFCLFTLGLCLPSSIQATPLEEIISGIKSESFLRYRYNDTRWNNLDFIKGNNKTGRTQISSAGKGAAHNFRADFSFTTPDIHGVSMNLGAVYFKNASTNIGGNYGEGLGAGEDGDFGVSTFYANIQPSNNTLIQIGKMRFETPFNDPSDDRGTGVVLKNKDIQGVSLYAAAYDTWSLDDSMNAIPFGTNENSLNKPIYQFAIDVSQNQIGASAWYVHIQDVYDYLAYATLGYKNDFLNLKAEYAQSRLNNGLFQTISPHTLLQKDHSLATFNIGINYAFLNARLGYIGSFQDGYKVSIDNQGQFINAGRIWNDNSITDISYAATGSIADSKHHLNVFFASLGFSPLENNTLAFTLDYVQGQDKNKTQNSTLTFYEITPNITYRYNKNLDFLIYYAMLHASKDPKRNTTGEEYADAQENRLRFQTIYRF